MPLKEKRANALSYLVVHPLPLRQVYSSRRRGPLDRIQGPNKLVKFLQPNKVDMTQVGRPCSSANAMTYDSRVLLGLGLEQLHSFCANTSPFLSHLNNRHQTVLFHTNAIEETSQNSTLLLCFCGLLLTDAPILY